MKKKYIRKKIKKNGEKSRGKKVRKKKVQEEKSTGKNTWKNVQGKKYGEKSKGIKDGEKSKEKKVREKNTWKTTGKKIRESTGKKCEEKSREVRWRHFRSRHFRLLRISPPQKITELCTYTTSGVYLIFILYSYYVPTYHRFFTAKIASQTSKRHLSACNIWKKYLNSTCIFLYFNNLVNYFSDARLRMCLISSKTVEISREKFHEIQKTNNVHDVKMNSTKYRFCWKQVLSSKSMMSSIK